MLNSSGVKEYKGSSGKKLKFQHRPGYFKKDLEMCLPMERLSNLFFELASKERLRILLQVQEKALRLTHLSKKLNLSVQETSRHLSRLSDAMLIKKDVDGCYHLTPYGEQTIQLLPGFKLLSQHREYFTTHTLSCLPHEFISRLGDLVNCTVEDDVMMAFHSLENMIREAQEYIWILSNQILMSTQPLLVEAVKRGVEFRLILPKDMTPPPDYKPAGLNTELFKMRILKKVEIAIAISEKDGGICFPTTDGRIDYQETLGTPLSADEHSHKWFRDLFLYYWMRAKPGKPKDYPPP